MGDIKKKPLSDKEEVFLEHYIRSWNGADAARKAGYPPESARQIACELLTKPYILKAKAERLKALTMETDEWFARVTEQARGDLGELLDNNGSIDLKGARDRGQLRLVAEYQVEVRTEKDRDDNPVPVVKTKLKLYSAQKALDMLGQRLAIPEAKRQLTEAQLELAEHKLTELQRQEALLDLLKRKAPKEVFDEVLRVLTGRPEDPSQRASGIDLEWDEGAKEEDSPAEAAPPAASDSE